MDSNNREQAPCVYPEFAHLADVGSSTSHHSPNYIGTSPESRVYPEFEHLVDVGPSTSRHPPNYIDTSPESRVHPEFEHLVDVGLSASHHPPNYIDTLPDYRDTPSDRDEITPDNNVVASLVDAGPSTSRHAPTHNDIPPGHKYVPIPTIPSFRDLHPELSDLNLVSESSVSQHPDYVLHDPADPPIYIQDEPNLVAGIQRLALSAAQDGQEFPILAYPRNDVYEGSNFESNHTSPSALNARNIVDTYFDAIRTKKDEVVASLIDNALVTPETTDKDGRTPLLAAIEAGNIRTVQQLMDFDADVNAFGITASIPRPTDHHSRRKTHAGPEIYCIYRTPLMLAASLGNLTIVKLLMETYNADDSLISPDGQHALRLAVNAGQREIVNYLPVRRGGGWRRWKIKHEKAMRRAKKAGRGIYRFGKFFVWDVPKFLLWTVPKEIIVAPIMEGLRWLRDHGAEIPGMIWDGVKAVGRGMLIVLEGLGICLKSIGRGILKAPRMIWDLITFLFRSLFNFLKKIPGLLTSALQLVWRVIKATPGAIATFLTSVFNIITDIAKFLYSILVELIKIFWRAIKATPSAIASIFLWFWKGIKSIAGAIGSSFASILSFLHTLLSGLVTFFRDITFQDVWNGFVAVLHSIFVAAPVKIWGWLKSFGQFSYDLMQKMFGWLGWLVWWLVRGLIELVVYVPKKLFEILASVGSSIGGAVQEVAIWVNPKR